MSKTIKIHGIILKISDTPGKDKLLHILTENGFITAFSTPKRNAGKKSYTYDLFTNAEIMLYQTDKGNYLVNSITPIEHFYNLREDITTLAAAGYFASLARHASVDADMDFKTLYNLIVNALFALSNGQAVKTVKPEFEIKIVQLMGFTPCLEADKKSSTYYFDPDDGRLYANEVTAGIYIPREVALSIYKIITSSVEELFLNKENEYTNILYSTAERYLLYHTEQDFDALNFLNGVI